MRDAAVTRGPDTLKIEPLDPVDLVVDHSVQVDFAGSQIALEPQHGYRVHPQPRALRVPKMGTTRLRYLFRRASRHRYCPSGKPRITGKRHAF